MIDVTSFGADPAGVTDSTGAIQAALDALPAKGGVLTFSPGRYHVSGQTQLTGRTGVTVLGDSAVLALTDPGPSTAGSRQVLLVDGCTGLTIRGLTIVDTSRDQQYNGLRVAASTGVTIADVTVRGMDWAGITAYDPAPGDSSDILITGCRVIDSRYGISVNSHTTRIVGCHISGPGKPIEDGYYDGLLVLTGAERVAVTGTTITGCGAAGIYTQACRDLAITGCVVTDCLGRGIELDGDTGTAVGAAITGNVVTDCYGNINLVKARQVTVSGNRVANNRASRVVACIAANIGTSDVLISGNHVRHAPTAVPAIWMADSASNVTRTANHIS